MHIDNRLIIIDGIAGSGKSVTCQRLCRQLILNGHAVKFYHEFHRPHPILEINTDSVPDWINESLARWHQLNDILTGQDSVVILDGAVFQCGIGELLERDTTERSIIKWAREVESIITIFKPAFIHLFQVDTDAALKRTIEQRNKSWGKKVKTFLSNTQYGHNRGLSGFDLYLDFNRSLRSIADPLFESLTIKKLALAVDNYRWDDYFQSICSFLGVSQIDDPFNPDDYCGEYHNEARQRRCHIKVDSGRLHVCSLFKIDKYLLPKDNDSVFVASWPDELTFKRDRDNRVISFASTGPWNRIGQHTWKRKIH